MDNIDHLIELETDEKNCCPTIYMVYDMMVSIRDDKKLLVFVNNEFTKLLDSIMENTFYNIIQETTRKEADLLKISKTYLTPNNNR